MKDDPRCFCCGGEPSHQHGVPTFNGRVVSNNSYANGIRPACSACSDLHARGAIPCLSSCRHEQDLHWWAGFVAAGLVLLMLTTLITAFLIAINIL